MSYFADSAWNYIDEKIRGLRQSGAGRRLLVTVPRLSEDATLMLAETFACKCIAAEVTLTFKTAESVWVRWTEAGKSKARQHDWLDFEAGLTSWRNKVPVPEKTSLVVLCGADSMTDAGSLSDFHRCDLETIWNAQMKRSFRSWVTQKLNEAAIGFEIAELREFDRLLVPLLDHGKADLMQIGDWLAGLDLNAAYSIREVQKLMLIKLERFKLPSFAGFPLGNKRASISPYLAKADDFFSYSIFLDVKERERALKSISAIIEATDAVGDIGLRLEDEDVRGPYGTGRTFLEGLQNYIQNEDLEDRNRLLACDFVTIIDKVLKFRKKEEPKPKETLHKLSGSPVEVVLHAVWQTFREFNCDRRFPDTNVLGISIAADRFKHDYENSPDTAADTVINRTELARQYLLRLLGGVDELVETHLELPGPKGEILPVACTLANDQIACVYGETAEPQLEFSVRLTHDASSDPLRRRFAWRLPEIQSYRLAEATIRWAKEALDADSSIWKLPVFHLPYYEELLRAADDEETRRVMLHCIRDARTEGSRLTNLLSREWLDSHDSLLPSLKALAEKYQLFVCAAFEKGLHGALFCQEWTELRQAYSAACRVVVESTEGAESQMAAILLRCFLIVQRRSRQTSGAWGTEPFERSGVTTVLHPSLLEMLEAQILFLFSCFNAAGGREQRREDRRRSFAEKIWSSYVDLASIQAPIIGLLHNEDQNLDTNVRGYDLIHRIGSPPETEATLSTRMLVRYDSGPYDEDVADTEMFRESRESMQLFRLMTDYFRLHPHARDGMSLAVFRNRDIQPIVAAVHQYVSKLSDPKGSYYVISPERRKPYAISITIFAESGDDAGVARWIEQWRECWEAGETESKFQAYRYCRLHIAHRIVETQQLGAFQKLINDNFEADIAVAYDFIGAGQGGNRFAEVTPFDFTDRTLKFPILEKSCCAVLHPTDIYKRSRVIGNRQFKLGTLHSQVMHRLKNQGVQPGKEFVILGVGDFAPWRGVIDALHRNAEWVICIDPSMDERLIEIPSGERTHEREIIGFSSGVGSHGEANFTISTEQFSLADVQVGLAAAIREVYASAGWSEDEYQLVAGSVLKEARTLSGLSLVRATCVGHYIRDFMAYALTRKMLREKKAILCDNLVSLDAYRHWFDLADNEHRPDLLWLTAWIDEGNRVCLNMHLIECKVAQRADEHLLRARAQIDNGLQVLTRSFAPRSAEDQTLSEDNRPDQRYWWLQLHRLVTSKTVIDNRDQPKVLSAMERLADGDYSINWGAAVFAFWSDDNSESIQLMGSWTVSAAENVAANIYEIGSCFVRTLALDGSDYPKSWIELESSARKGSSNICEALDDTVLPPGKDDDEDAPLWEEQTEQDSGEDETTEPRQQEAEKDHVQVETNDGEPLPNATPPEKPITAPVFVGPNHDHSSAFTATVEQNLRPAPVVGPSIPQRILLGSTVGGGKPVYWEFGHPELANRHMVVFGTSGMGKTYAIQCLLCEFGREMQNSLILDYTDGFIPSKLEEATKASLAPHQHFIQQSPLPISPFKAQVSVEAGITFKDTPISIAKRVAAIFRSVYELGSQQFPVLIEAINDGVQKYGDDFGMMQVLDILHTYIDDGVHPNGPVRTTISKLRQFIISNPFAEERSGIGWHRIFDDTNSRCHVFQFHMVDRYSARAVIEFVLWDLYAFVVSCGNKSIPRVVVLDEVQNLDLGPDAPVAKYLTEGRKHGLALITATQTVRGVGGVSDARVSRLFQAEHKLFFKPTENEIREHAQLLNNAIGSVSVQDWASRLASLQVGECWSLGRILNEATGKLMFQAQRIRIAALEDRGFHA